jgi:hypothetical protein
VPPYKCRHLALRLLLCGSRDLAHIPCPPATWPQKLGGAVDPQGIATAATVIGGLIGVGVLAYLGFNF